MSLSKMSESFSLMSTRRLVMRSDNSFGIFLLSPKSDCNSSIYTLAMDSMNSIPCSSLASLTSLTFSSNRTPFFFVDAPSSFCPLSDYFSSSAPPLRLSRPSLSPIWKNLVTLLNQFLFLPCSPPDSGSMSVDLPSWLLVFLAYLTTSLNIIFMMPS